MNRDRDGVSTYFAYAPDHTLMGEYTGGTGWSDDRDGQLGGLNLRLFPPQDFDQETGTEEANGDDIE